MKELSQDLLKELLSYDSITGIFVWKKTRRGVKSGKRAGFVVDNKYRYIRVNGSQYLEHRLAWLYIYGVWPNQTDHINRHKRDNRIINLRDVSASINQRNTGLFSNNTSKITGVNKRTNIDKWRAYIYIEGKTKHLGQFRDFFDACCCRKSAENKHGYNLEGYQNA